MTETHRKSAILLDTVMSVRSDDMKLPGKLSVEFSKKIFYIRNATRLKILFQ